MTLAEILSEMKRKHESALRSSHVRPVTTSIGTRSYEHTETIEVINCKADKTEVLLKALEVAITCLKKYELEAAYYEITEVAEAPKALTQIEAILKESV